MSRPKLLLLGGFSILARFAVSFRGSNTDFEAYQIVAGHVVSGENVYSSTYRYNYGPVWFEILGIFHRLASLVPGDDVFQFRSQIILLLSVTDFFLGYLLWRRFGPSAALFLLFNPVSIIITGFHNQFDNLAILLGLLGCIFIEKSLKTKQDFSLVIGLVAIGVSLATKHIMIFVPLVISLIPAWSIRQRFWCLIFPYFIFLTSFIPWIDSKSIVGIENNVFRYRSFENLPLLSFLSGVVGVKPNYSVGVLFWICGILVVAISVRKESLFDQVFLHLVAMVALSPAVANQYLSIATIGVAWKSGRLGMIWVLLAGLFLTVDVAGLHLDVPGLRQFSTERSTLGYEVLCAGLLLFLVVRVTKARTSKSSFDGQGMLSA